MLRRFSIDFAILCMYLDGIFIALALRSAILLRPYIGFLPATIDYSGPFNVPPFLYGAFAVTWVLVLLLFSVYDTRRNFRVVDELTSLTTGSLLASITLAGLLYLTYRDISRALYLLFIIIAFLLLLSYRLVYRFGFRNGIFGIAQQRRVLILGAGTIGKEIEKHIKEHSSLGMHIVGFLDDDPEKDRSVLGALVDARSIVIREHVHDVVLALPRRAYQKSSSLITKLHDLPVKVWVVPDYFALALNRATMEDLAGMPMIDLRAPALNDYQRMVKRFFDISITLLIFPIALPFMVIIALLIRLDSPGKVIFRQRRVGENGRLFDMYKFRSMVENAEQLRHLVEKVDEKGRIIQHKSSNDPRVTRIGSFIRRTSLDELPQLFNVLKGDMSLVGPRPELPYLVAKYEPWQRKRFAVPQGITGWWQINGRSDKPMHLNTNDDLYYVQNYSIWLDLQIMFKTVWVVFRRKGAY